MLVDVVPVGEVGPWPGGGPCAGAVRDGALPADPELIAWVGALLQAIFAPEPVATPR